ncbi:alpha/beta hydrolase family protein [Caulobacter sp. ErkDOM-E]|uniref:alpha/beta hydrolase family protein n=1 Tax=Caulobacter sp. ErkDOM-E TaxID=3402778 RepID=UPI003AF684BB
MSNASRLNIAAFLAAASVAFAPAAHAHSPTAPWSAPASVETIAEDIEFRSGDAALSGTLYLPKGASAAGAVVVTHGASSPLRSSPLYRHLLEMLPPLGIAVFVYDRRGSGRSGGDLKTSDYAMLADDAIAALRRVKTDPRIDARRVGLWGLSQGGWVSLLAAARAPAEPAFVVSISAPVVTADVQMNFFSANALRVNGYPQSEIDEMLAARKAVDDYMRGTGDRADAQRRVDAIKTRPWFNLIYMGKTVGPRETSRWRKEIENDPLKSLEGGKAPTLMLFGAADPGVPVAASIASLRERQAQLSNVEAAVVARADHSMQLSVSPKDQMDPARADDGAPESPEYFGRLAAWLTKQGITRGR